MDYQNFIGKIYDPHPQLKAYISQYNIVNLDAVPVDHGRIKAIPFGMAGIMIFIDNSALYIESEKFGLHTMQKANVVGFSPVHVGSYFHPASPHLRGISMSLTYLGANELLGIPVNLLFNQIVDLELILGADVKLLIERLEEISEEEKMIDVLNDFFIRLLKGHHCVNQKFIGLVSHIVNSNSQVLNVNELARQVHMCERSLQRRFKLELGLTPKEFLRLSRFLKVFRLMLSQPQTTIQDLVWYGKFYDQSHLIHEFQSITDYSPKDFCDVFGPA